MLRGKNGVQTSNIERKPSSAVSVFYANSAPIEGQSTDAVCNSGTI